MAEGDPDGRGVSVAVNARALGMVRPERLGIAGELGNGTELAQHDYPAVGPGIRPPGVEDRPAPFPGVGPNDQQYDRNGVVARTTGVGAVFENTAAMPVGEQNPFQVVGKTWRADPAPWDADIYQGFTPVNEGDA